MHFVSFLHDQTLVCLLIYFQKFKMILRGGEMKVLNILPENLNNLLEVTWSQVTFRLRCRSTAWQFQMTK